jgi:hypothetical protein
LSGELSIADAPYGTPVYAFFPDLAGWCLVTRYGLPTGADLWSSDTGFVITPRGPAMFRIVHAASRTLH